MRMFPRGIAHDALVQLRGLGVLALLALMRVMALARDDIVRHGVRRLGDVGSEGVFEAVGHVLLVAGMIGVSAHRAVEIQASVLAGHEGAVDGDLVQVNADTVVLGVAVEEHAELEQRVRAVFDAGDHASGGKGGLLDVAVVVFRVLVEDEVAEFVHGELGPWPNFGYVEGVETEFIGVGFFGLHDLDVGFPSDFFASLDGFPELLLGVIWVLA